MNRLNFAVFLGCGVFILWLIIGFSAAICNFQGNLIALQMTHNLVNNTELQTQIPLLSICQSKNLLLLQAKKNFLSHQHARGIAQMMALFENFPNDFEVKVGLHIVARDFTEKNKLADAIYFFSLADDIYSLMSLGDTARANHQWDIALQAYQSALTLTNNRKDQYLIYINLARVAWYGYQDILLADQHLMQAHLTMPEDTYVCQVGFRLWTAASDASKAAQWQNCTP